MLREMGKISEKKHKCQAILRTKLPGIWNLLSS